MSVRNHSKVRKRLVTGFLSGVLVCILLFSTAGTPALAANGTKNATSRAIAIVFDNSGSMYTKQNKAWCRATYAIEVFASMMNQGDTLQVYPMYEVTVGGKSYTSQNPFSVSGGEDMSIIQSMYTPFAGDTPIETIGDAYNGLRKTDADEKWLIVLTDGAVFYENGAELKGSQTKERLEEVLAEYNQDVNVLFLGIDSVAVIPEVSGGGKYQYHTDKASDSRDTLTKLTEMCNMIFGRDVLNNAGKQIDLDVSMKKLILFVQGKDISGVTLKNSSGASVGSPSLEYSPRYGTQGAGTVRTDGTPLSFSYDDSLSGYIAIYDTELDADVYSLSYSGDVTSVSVYYEPDVDLTAALTDVYGAVMTESSELYPGTYFINYGLVDKYGNGTASDLLGKTGYTVTYSVNGEEKTVKSDESGQVALELNEGDELDGKITVTYLSGYTIAKDSKDFGWPFGGFKIVPRPAGLLELRVSGGKDTYNLSELENNPYTVQLVYEGTPLTADQLSAAKVSVIIEGGNAGYTLEQVGNGCSLNLNYAATAADTVCGGYTMRITADYTNEFDVTSTSSEISIPFTIEDDGYSLAMDIKGDGYFVISKLKESDPIKVVLSVDGESLTDEQLSATVLIVDGDGLTCESEPLYGESAFAVRIADDSKARSGHYDLHFTARSRDQVGREISAEGGKNVELSTYPLWLRILVICMIIALIIALIMLYLSMKILPKRIGINVTQTAFIVNGEPVKGAARCTYTGGGKRHGSLQVSLPPYSGSALVRGGFNLTLQAVSPRRVKSSRRRVLVTNVSPINSTALQTLSVGTHSLVKVDEGDGVTWMFDSKQVPSANVATKFEMGGKPTCTFMGETIAGESFTLTVQLQFR